MRFRIDLQGVSAVQLTWWFAHMANNQGEYWKSLSPANEQIHWNVDPADDAHQLIGAVFSSDQKVSAVSFPSGRLHLQAQFADYITQSRRA